MTFKEYCLRLAELTDADRESIMSGCSDREPPEWLRHALLHRRYALDAVVSKKTLKKAPSKPVKVQVCDVNSEGKEKLLFTFTIRRPARS